MASRTIAIGDIHGCDAAFQAVLAAIDLRRSDTLVMLGDYIDRGPNSRGVIDRLLGLASRCHLVALMGNHEEMLLDNLEHPDEPDAWLIYGGRATLQSYGPDAGLADIPAEHVEFLRNCQNYFETDTHFFVHANYDSDTPLDAQQLYALRWVSLKHSIPGPHISGKTAVVGHTSQKSGEILDLGHLKCIDTYCFGGRWLTALDVESGQTWQASAQGELRTSSGE
ncbi:MAG: metallophosphoesterase family protein [Pirellulales bacterium]